MQLSTGAKRLFGLLMIVGGALIIILGVTKPNPLADRHTYHAVFDNVQGLGAIDRDVRVAGAKVGTIGSVERVGDDVVAELVLFEDFPIHEDARADMRPHTLFEGSNFVDLYTGSPSAPLLEEGDTIPIEQTSVYVTLDEALRILRPDIRESLRDLAAVGAKTFRGQAIEGVQRTLKGAPALTRALGPATRAAQGPGRRELVGAIGGMAETVDALASKEAELVPLLQRLNRTNAALTVDGGAPLDATLAAMPGALRELFVTAPVLTALIDRLDRFSIEVTPALPELALALDETAPVLRRATPVLTRATPLIRDTRFLTSGLGKAGPGLIRMFELLEQPLIRFEDALDLVNEPTVHGAPAYRQLVAGAFTGFDGVFRTFQTEAQNPDQPGHQLRIGTFFHEDAIADLMGGLPQGSSAPDGATTASCADVARVSPRAARQLEAVGGCE